MVAYRLRIELPDRPGALAAVTGDIAASKANIVSIDVHEVEDGMAVDEIVVEVSETWAPGPLAAALAANGAGTLLSSRRLTNREDPITAALHAVADMVGGEALDQRCCQALLAVTHGTSAQVLAVPDVDSEPAAGLAVERRSTVVARAGDEGAGWVLAAVDDPHDPESVGLIRRSLNVRFSATEVSRVEALLRIRRQLLKTTATPA